MDKTLKERIEKLEHGDYTSGEEVPWYKRVFRFGRWSIGSLVSITMAVVVVVNFAPMVRESVESGETGDLISVLIRIGLVVAVAGSAVWLSFNPPDTRLVGDKEGDLKSKEEQNEDLET